MGVSGQRHAPGKGPPVSIVQEAGWAPEPVWTQRLQEKSFFLCRGSKPDRPVVQPLARHYSDWATWLACVCVCVCVYIYIYSYVYVERLCWIYSHKSEIGYFKEKCIGLLFLIWVKIGQLTGTSYEYLHEFLCAEVTGWGILSWGIS
jgi:hypothetical protein